jgi:hypothetical protein
MLGNITASECMVLCLSQLQDAGAMHDEHASLAKAFCTVKMRETVGYARELLGGNGILLDENVGRFVADAEAIYSYEVTREMNTPIVGRAITGFSAFVRRSLDLAANEAGGLSCLSSPAPREEAHPRGRRTRTSQRPVAEARAIDGYGRTKPSARARSIAWTRPCTSSLP